MGNSSSPEWSWKKGRKTVVVVTLVRRVIAFSQTVVVQKQLAFLFHYFEEQNFTMTSDFYRAKPC